MREMQSKILRLRSPVRYFGGKGNMLAKLMRVVPSDAEVYVEPYCGGASLFFARDPAPVEVLNDLNKDIVNLFRVFQDKSQFEEFRHRLMYTPYARAEFERALTIRDSDEQDPVLRAWAFFVCQNQGFGGTAKRPSDWGRVFTSYSGIAGTVNKWLMRLSMLDAFRWRLMCVQIECRDALECIQYWDSPKTVFYCDPPYMLSTRTRPEYTVETDDEHHAKLVQVLLSCKGRIALSCYWHSVYQPLVDSGWKRIDFHTVCHAAGRVRASSLQGTGAAKAKVPRVETVLVNYDVGCAATHATGMLHAGQLDLMDHMRDDD